jgi:hypothetical protein
MTTARAVSLADGGRVLLLDPEACPQVASGGGLTAANAWWVTLLHALLAVVLSAGTVWLRSYAEERVATTLPSVQAIDVYRLIIDDTPVPVTITAGWEKITEWTTHDAVLGDVTLWRRMHVEDWDGVPAGLRERALESMLTRYRHVLASPSTWDRMGADDWDRVPQPVRTLAYRHMAEYWSGYYGVGGAYAIPRGLMADTIAAIIMSESWFEHRAENTNRWGNRDLGVAQASDGARARMVELYDQGRADFRLSDDDYFNPWSGTRFAAFWVALVLDQVDGDLAAAIRAYHRGTTRALAGLGVQYQLGVQDRRRRYIRNDGGSAAWDYLWKRDREIRREEWPWMAIARRSGGVFMGERSATAVTLAIGLVR